MRTFRKPLTRIVGLLFAGCLSQSLWAATNDTNAQVQALQAQAAQLQVQLAALQSQLASLQNAQARQVRQQSGGTASPAPTSTPAASSSASSPYRAPPSEHPGAGADRIKLSPQGQGTRSKGVVTAYQQNVQPIVVADSVNSGRTPYGQSMLANIGGFAVITSPYLHPQAAYNGGDLIVNFSSINKDANVLQQRQTFQHAMYNLGYGMPSNGTLLELSGEVEGLATAQRKYSGGEVQSLDLTDAELDMQALINRWLTAFMAFAYNNFPDSSGNRTFNSGIFLDSGFLTFGDLDVTKWRATIGQFYVPFGLYNSFLVTDPINKTLFRTKGRPLLIGYGIPGSPGFSAEAFIFQGTTHQGNFNPEITNVHWNQHINQAGADASYQFVINENVHTTWGASYINNVADSNGMQATGVSNSSTRFEGFDDNSGTQVINHRVPGVDGRGEIDIFDYSLIGEYTTSTRSFSPVNLSYNGHGAKPAAWHVEGVYTFSPWGKPSTIALGYDRSYQSLALNVPEQRLALAWNISIWRNTLLSLEVRRDFNYGANDYASGDLGPIFYPKGPFSNVASAQFQVFF